MNPVDLVPGLDAVADNWPRFLDGFLTTLRLLAISGLGALVVGVVVAQRSLEEVSDTVALVRNRLLLAAGISLGVAIALGLALSNTLTRRLGQLQRSALRITHEGPEAPAPIDRGRARRGSAAGDRRRGAVRPP